jgi:septal ring factor EnvC (AmiA/AmiB activator)
MEEYGWDHRLLRRKLMNSKVSFCFRKTDYLGNNTETSTNTMNIFIMSHVIAAAVYMLALLFSNNSFTSVFEQLERELLLERNLRKDVETKLAQEKTKVFDTEETLYEMEKERDTLRKMVVKLEDEVESLNKKVEKIVSSATQLVEEAEMPHLVMA